MSKQDILRAVKDGTLTPDEAIIAAENFTPSEIVSGRAYKFGTQESRMKAYADARELRNGILRNKVPFITPDFFPDFYLCQGAILVGGVSGQGKSTIAGNLIAGFLTSCPDKSCLVISNEETHDAVYERIAAVLLGMDFRKIHKNLMGPQERAKVENTIANKIAPFVEVVCEGEFDTSMQEDVCGILESSPRNKCNFVVVDYHQMINGSRADPKKETFKVSKEMGVFYKNFGKRNGIPVCVLVQLSARNDSPQFKDRVENDRTLYNHAFIAIEAKPDFDTQSTMFKIHKDRFNNATGKEITMKFEGGRFVMPGGL